MLTVSTSMDWFVIYSSIFIGNQWLHWWNIFTGNYLLNYRKVFFLLIQSVINMILTFLRNVKDAISLMKLMNIYFNVRTMLTGVDNSSKKMKLFFLKSQFLTNLHRHFCYSLSIFVAKQHKKHYFNTIIHFSSKLQLDEDFFLRQVYQDLQSQYLEITNSLEQYFPYHLMKLIWSEFSTLWKLVIYMSIKRHITRTIITTLHSSSWA